MSPEKKLVLYGGGDMALEIAGFVADVQGSPESITDIIDKSGTMSADLAAFVGHQVRVHRDLSTVERPESKQMLVCIGAAEVRARIFADVSALPNPFAFATLVHPSAYLAPGVVVGRGAIVAPLAYIGPGAQISDNVYVNVHATVGHHAVLGRSSVVSPHADLNGRTTLGEAVFVGAGAILAPGSTVGRYSKVANGAVFSGRCGEGFLLAGNPAKGRPMFKVPNDGILTNE